MSESDAEVVDDKWLPVLLATVPVAIEEHYWPMYKPRDFDEP